MTSKPKRIKGIPFKYPFAFFTDLSDQQYLINVYVDLSGHIRPRHNPTPGLYYFDGQFFYKKATK